MKMPACNNVGIMQSRGEYGALMSKSLFIPTGRCTPSNPRTLKSPSTHDAYIVASPKPLEKGGAKAQVTQDVRQEKSMRRPLDEKQRSCLWL
jgi:hypothetical protein